MHRREVLKCLAMAAAYTTVGGHSMSGINPQPGAPSSSGAPAAQGAMIYRGLGRTGERISAIGMGGFHLGQPKLSDDESIRLIRTAIDGGINFMDNSWDYNEGRSEIRMGRALKDGYRKASAAQ